MSLHMLTANSTPLGALTTPPLRPLPIILAPFRQNFISSKSIGEWLRDHTEAEGMTYEEDNPSCQWELTYTGIVAILNEFTLRTMTSLGIREVLGPSQWTPEQQELYVFCPSNVQWFLY